MLCQGHHIVAALAQGRYHDGKNIEPVKQIFPKRARAHHFGQIPVGSGNNAYIYGNAAVAAHPLKATLLQQAQQLGLYAQWQLAHLVQKNCAAVCLFKTPLAKNSAGKRTFFMAEQFAFHNALGQGRTVAFDKRPARRKPAVVQGVGHHLLTHAAFAKQQHRGARGRNLANELVHILHGPRNANHVRRMKTFFEVTEQQAGAFFPLHLVDIFHKVQFNGMSQHLRHEAEHIDMLLQRSLCAVQAACADSA